MRTQVSARQGRPKGLPEDLSPWHAGRISQTREFVPRSFFGGDRRGCRQQVRHRLGKETGGS
ncbi:hypothetical protein [Paracraurococcus lichenis]|uniref:Uncharacterized protein n=1 Tax=Paracraurococcus lichenis TaxID=3064888 RepID=A0ABT9ECW1_9PROT|nr:hypothetical protein [Paracraurococcus sp. LOR1-02]MDO9714055.1 hypothetical protein [Paracraurococcus sp. LOR1-02]